MIGELSLKESYFTSAAMVPLPIVTILFFLFIQQHFLTTSKYLSLNMASGVAEASPHFLQVRIVTHSTTLESRVCILQFARRSVEFRFVLFG